MQPTARKNGGKDTSSGAVLDILRSFDNRDRDLDDQIMALTALCAVLGRGLVLGGAVQRQDIQAAARAIRCQLPPGHAGQGVIDRFLEML